MKKISITLLLCLLCLTGMAQGQKALDLKDITSGRPPGKYSGSNPYA